MGCSPLIDEDGCYDPAEFNDGLVLGMKGTFAQAELHIINARLQGGKINKALKGELRFSLPVGFVFDDNKIVLDPDQEVQGAVRTVFELFEREGTAYGVVRQFQEIGLRFPRRSYGGALNGKLLWGRLSHARLLGILTNPSYAGTYAFGRRQSRKQVVADGEIEIRRRPVPQDEWRVVIPNHHPGYVAWEKFVANRHRLATNRTNSEVLAGPAREGLCLLQGLLLCGLCGRRLSVRYTGNGGLYPIYQCVWKPREGLARCACFEVRAQPLDDAIAERIVTAVTPATIKLALEALTHLEERDRAVAAQWRRRIERVRYESELAERRYEEVGPSNRVIAATLETRWNDAVQRLIDVEAEFSTFERQTLRAVTAEQKRQILALARDFPRLWSAPTTIPRDRKRMLRLLIRDITVAKGSEPKLLRLNIRWQGGASETLELRLPPNRAEVIRYPDVFVRRIRTLATEHDDQEIVALLARENLTSSTGKSFTAGMIRWIRFKHRIPSPPIPAGTLTVAQLRDKYGVSSWVVYQWIQRGLIDARRKKAGMPYAVTITEHTDLTLQHWIANSAHTLRHPPNPIV